LKLAALLLVAALLQGPLACYCIGAPPALDQAALFDIVVVDPDEAPDWLVGNLTARGKTVLAYINVGYAEEWRWYWEEAVAAGIVHEPTEYGGEYYVEFWSEEWREIIGQYIRDALAAGYSGVYLDNIDAATIIAESGVAWASHVDPEAEMTRLVAYAKSISPIVYINIGSAVHLLYDEGLLDSVDGVLREEVFRYLEGPGQLSRVPPEESRAVLEALTHARDRGVNVMVVEFVHTPLDAAYYYAAYRLLGITPILQPDTDPYYMRPPLAPRLPGGPAW